ncbi:MAG: hypothetical protein M1357_02330 [Candidatus Marsarchaeota archaeon]|nr:hypothetical protein [Candidatus Marsarchaeota archaeon]
MDLPVHSGFLVLDKGSAAKLGADLAFIRLTSILDEKIKLSRGSSSKPAWVSRLSEALRSRLPAISLYSSESSYPVDPSKYPPCIRLFIDQMSKGVNIPHFARFTTAAFMRQIGSSKDEVVKLFTSASNYNADKTVYQVSHIFGEIGSHTKYTTPGCDTLKLSRLCPIEGYCHPRVRHPVTVYQINWRRSGAAPGVGVEAAKGS